MSTRLFLPLLCFIPILWACAPPNAATGSNSNANVSTLLSQQRYQFDPTYIITNRGRQRNLAGQGYKIKITKDSIDCDLPYIGRANTAPMSSTGIGMKFISTDFNYTAETGKKGQQLIAIKPKDASDVQMLYLTVFDNGSSEVSINSNSRESISYSGNLIGIPVRK